MLEFFFASKLKFTKRFSSIFPDNGAGDEEADDESDKSGPSIAGFFGWLYILRNLDTRRILDITGDDHMFRVNIGFIFQWMAMELDIQQEEARQQRLEMMRNK